MSLSMRPVDIATRERHRIRMDAGRALDLSAPIYNDPEAALVQFRKCGILARMPQAPEPAVPRFEP